MIHDDDDPGMDDALSPGLRSLLDDGAEGPAMSTAARDRLLGRVLASVAVATVAGASAASAASAASLSSTTTTAATATATTATGATATVATATAATTGIASALLFKASLAVGLAVAVVGVGTVVSRPPSTMSSSSAPAAPSASAASWLLPAVSALPAAGPPVLPPADAAAVAPAVAVVDNGPLPLPAKAPKPAPSSSSAASTAPVSTVSASWEVAQLEAARLALSRGDATEALGLLSEHAKRAPASTLVEEREALMVLALAKAGRVDEARAAALAFAARHPDSLFLDRVRAAVR